MMTALDHKGNSYPIRLATPEAILCLPKAKQPRLVGNWAESDGVEYDLDEPIWLEEHQLSLAVQTDCPLLPEDRVVLHAFGREIPLEVRRITPHLPFAGWAMLEASIYDLTPIFGAVEVVKGVIDQHALLGMGVNAVPDWGVLRSEPQRKAAFERSLRVGDNTPAHLAPGKKERSVSMEVWVRGNDCVDKHLALCHLLRSSTDGHWRLGGEDFYLRYQSMEIVDYYTSDIIISRLTLQQYSY